MTERQPSRLDAAITKFTGLVLRWRWTVIVASIVLCVAAGTGTSRLVMSTHYRHFFGAEDPNYKAFLKLESVYTKRDNLMFVVHATKGDAFAPRTLGDIKRLTDEVWKLPYVSRVDSITNFQNSRASGDDLIVSDLIGDAATETDRAAARKIAVSEPLLVNKIISPDARTTGVFASLILPDDDPNAAPKVIAKARALLADLKVRNPDLVTALSGSTAFHEAFNEASAQDMATLVPAMYAVIALGAFVLLRSFVASGIMMIIVALSTVAAMGLAGWFGIVITPLASMAPTIILTLAVADSLHLLSLTQKLMSDGLEKKAAIVEAVRLDFVPIFLTSFTTAVGFLSFNAADSPPFHDLGNIVTIGVSAAWILSMTLLPALVAVLPLKGHQGGVVSSGRMRALADWVIARRRWLLAGSAVMTVVLGAVVPTMELGDRFLTMLNRTLEFRRDTDLMVEKLTGVDMIYFSIESGEAGGVADPAFLRKVDAFVAWARAHDGIRHVTALTDIVRRINRNMNGDDPAFYRLPEDRNLAAQYLLLYELSLPNGLDLTDQVNVDKSALRVSVTFDNVSTRLIRDFKAAGEAWIKKNIASSGATEGTSSAVMFSFIAQRNIESMLSGTLWSMLIISLCLIVPFRSLSYGLISLVPNLVPAVWAFGLWAIFEGRIGLPAAVVVGASMGIIVDDTIHMMSKYLRARREEGLSCEDAIRHTFESVGPALWIMTAILVAGFLMLAFSPYEVSHALGLLTAITIVIAIFGDFFLLPPLLMLLEGRKPKASPAHGRGR